MDRKLTPRHPRVYVYLLLVLVTTVAAAQLSTRSSRSSTREDNPTIETDKSIYLPGETIVFHGTNWTPGEAVTIVIRSDGEEPTTIQATADRSGAFSITSIMPVDEVEGNKFSRLEKGAQSSSSASGGAPQYVALATGSTSGASAEAEFEGIDPTPDGARLIDQETYWMHRITYPTGNYNPEWLRKAAADDSRVGRGVPSGAKSKNGANTPSPLALNPSGFTALGPKPERMTGCSGCFDYTTTAGRINAIVIDPTTTTNGSIVAYAASVGGGVWKTTNCCSSATTWTVTTDDPLISTLSIDTLAIDPNNHNVVYAGTGDLNFGSFSMGSQGILKTLNGGATWTVLGANVFGAGYTEPAGQFPQYDAVGKVRVDPNNSNRVAAGTKKGLYFSYDGGVNWTGPCTTNGFATQRQDTTGLELTNMGGGVTRIIAAIGTRGFATTVQYDLGNNGANGIYSATMPASGCPTLTSIAGNGNGFVFGTAVTGSPYATGANLNAGSGTAYGGLNIGNQVGRIDIGVAPSDPNVIYAQVQSIAANNNGGCGNTNGCQLGAFATTNGGATWSFMAGSAGGSLRECASSGAGSSTTLGSGDYPQNWYDQGVVVDPNNADRVFFDTFDVWLATRTGTQWYDVTCGYSNVSPKPVHVDQHALAFVNGPSGMLVLGNDGGAHGTTNANVANNGTARPTWFNMDGGFNTIEFYNGDISANFATDPAPKAGGGAQDNMDSFVYFGAPPTGPVQWQGNVGGDGFFVRIDGKGGYFYASNNNGALHRCTGNCANTGGVFGGDLRNATMRSDTQSFVEPFDLFRGKPGALGNAECGARCNHIIVGSNRLWENIAADTGTTWTARTVNLTKNTLGNRSFINNLHYSPANQTLAIVATNDGNVQAVYGLGGASGVLGTAVNLTGGNAVLPNRPILDAAFDPNSDNTVANPMIGYAAVGGFNANTPGTPGHVFRVVCNVNCASSTWTDKSSNLPDIPVDSIIVNPNFPQQVFAGTDIGLYYTDDITAVTPVWQRFQAGLPNVMIWSMSIDRGNTTLSLWTRSRGAYVWPLTLGPLNPLPTNLSVDAATGSFGGTVNLSATLTSGGNPVAGKSIAFTLNGNSVGSANTDANGVATLTNASLTGINGGLYPTGVGASFAGDSVYAAASATNTLTVLQAPEITCPASFSQDADEGLCSTTISFTGAHAATAIGYPVPTITYSPDSGTFGVGTTTVTATATNSEGTDDCTFTVTVVDNQPPIVSTATAGPNVLWPPEHQMIPITVNYTATDNCSVGCVLTVTSNEPINGLGDGDTAPDWQIIDAHHVMLRSERSGKLSGRTYTITVTCTDPAGHTVVRTTTVAVPKSQTKTGIPDWMNPLGPPSTMAPTGSAGSTTGTSANGSVLYVPYLNVTRPQTGASTQNGASSQRVKSPIRKKKRARSVSAR
jgi:HYR domain